ncbi:hypothetical protein H696_06175 [Fonticula alba]|uniref:U3 small nucleolar RNA-associated protein 14 n=1 Tax=Fonticula alba TaxID=691883 RepID=A0A058YZV6_FONAL|nr:hypothetical protein H696_06175 [Fonticula alba]KCV67406.1 hypothetical protein H696_06175 [Fonticula alba]|eukprot:XP_009498193.1 hypothetical protein H696_06175 [Fonticula alba]
MNNRGLSRRRQRHEARKTQGPGFHAESGAAHLSSSLSAKKAKKTSKKREPSLAELKQRMLNAFENDDYDDDGSLLAADVDDGAGGGPDVDDRGFVKIDLGKLGFNPMGGNPDDDEEIDEDEAFGESDEDTYGDILNTIAERTKNFSRLNASDRKRRHVADDDEDDEEDDSDEDPSMAGYYSGDDEDEYAGTDSLADMLMAGVGASDDDYPGIQTDSDSEEELSFAGEDASDSDAEDAEDAAFLAEFTARHRQAEGSAARDAEVSRVQAVKLVQSIDGAQPEQTEAYAESEMNLQPSAGLSLRDLISSASRLDTTASGMKGQLKSLKKIRDAELAPVHSVEAERLTREAAYNMAKDSVTEWQPFVARLNSMEFVSFPLMDTSVSNQRLNSINELASTHESETALEKDIQVLLETAGLQNEASIAALEEDDDQMKALTAEEMAERRAQLARMRHLLLSNELKQARQAKIKSKAFRRVKKRERERKELSIDEMAAVDPQAARERLERMEMQRLEERMTQRHRGGGKWSREMAKRGVRPNELLRGAMDEQSRISEELRTKRTLSLDAGLGGGSYSDEDDGALSDGLDVVRPGHGAGLRAVIAGATLDPGAAIGQSSEASASRSLAAALSGRGSAVAAGGASLDDHGDEFLLDMDVTGGGNGGGAEPQANPFAIALDQKDLVERAFEGDDVFEADFQKEKDHDMELNLPDLPPADVPGWGSWGGEGARPSQAAQRREAKRQRTIEKIKSAARAGRSDANLAHVIINDRVNKKQSKLHADILPHGFSTRSQYDNLISRPVGAAFNTQTAAERATRPRVMTKAGHIIEAPRSAKMTLPGRTISGKE